MQNRDEEQQYPLYCLTVRPTSPEHPPGPLVAARDLTTDANPLFDYGVLHYLRHCGAALPPTPFETRSVLAAAVWSVHGSYGGGGLGSGL